MKQPKVKLPSKPPSKPPTKEPFTIEGEVLKARTTIPTPTDYKLFLPKQQQMLHFRSALAYGAMPDEHGMLKGSLEFGLSHFPYGTTLANLDAAKLVIKHFRKSKHIHAKEKVAIVTFKSRLEVWSVHHTSTFDKLKKKKVK